MSLIFIPWSYEPSFKYCSNYWYHYPYKYCCIATENILTLLGSKYSTIIVDTCEAVSPNICVPVGALDIYTLIEALIKSFIMVLQP